MFPRWIYPKQGLTYKGVAIPPIVWLDTIDRDGRLQCIWWSYVVLPQPPAKTGHGLTAVKFSARKSIVSCAILSGHAGCAEQFHSINRAPLVQKA
jgi:hypothetical protein